MRPYAPALLVVPLVACAPAASGGDPRARTPPGTRDSAADTGGAPQGALLEGVTWRIAWDRHDLLPSEAGRWQIDRADGASFVLETGWLVLTSVSLEPCDDTPAAARRLPPHGWPDHPSADTDTWALPLHEPMDQELSQRSFAPDWVCEVGVGLFQASSETRDLPEEPELLGTSLQLEGAVRPSPTDPWTPVAWRSSLSAEHDALLPPLRASAPVLTVSLSPARLFDGVFLDDPPELAGRSALTNLARSLTVAAEP